MAFSIDPDYDTPEQLTKYLSQFDVADESKWHLLTGYDQTFIEQFAANSFKMLVKDDPNNDQVIHGSTFYLVDEKGIHPDFLLQNHLYKFLLT